MRIAATHSHFGGLEYIQIRVPEVWESIHRLVSRIDLAIDGARSPDPSRSGRSGGTSGSQVASAMRSAFGAQLQREGWLEEAECYWRSPDQSGNPDAKRVALELLPDLHHNGADCLHTRHLALFANGRIDVGIEIVPTESLCLGFPDPTRSFEEFARRTDARGVDSPRVPLVIVGVEA